MDMVTFKQDSIPEVRESRPSAMDTFMLCDAGGLAHECRKWAKGSWGKGMQGLERGDPALTAKADRYMTRFEDDIFLGRGWNVTDDVVGGVPNVPAYLAGYPQHMRRRQRVTNNRGPLLIMFELTGSSGNLDSRHERGAAMLALVRLLTNTRPVEFWTLTTLGERNTMNMVACKMDTAPLDVARSAAMLMDNDVLSVICEMNRKQLGGGSWSYGSDHMERRWSGEALRRILQPGIEILFIPATYLSDNTKSPEQWVRTMLAKYGMSAVQREED